MEFDKSKSNREERLYLVLSHAFLLASLIGTAVFFAFTDISRLVFLVPDDASYYFNIAQNFVDGKGFSFDGINSTNGFQPLWQYMLIAVFLFSNHNSESMFRVCMIFQTVVLYVSGLIFMLSLHRFFSRRIVFISVLVFILLIFFHAANGMESAVLILMLVILYSYVWKTNVLYVNKPAQVFIFGIFLGLVTLARLDMIFLVFIVSVIYFIKIFKPGRLDAARPDSDGVSKPNIINFIIIVFSVSLILVPYLTYNYIEFGNPVPISGVLKSGSLKESLAVGIRTKFDDRTLLFTFLAAAYIIWFAFNNFRRTTNNEQRITNNEQRSFRTGTAILASAVILHFLTTLFFMKWAIYPWHFMPYRLFVCFAGSELANFLFSLRHPAKRGTLYSAGITLILVCSIALSIRQKFNYRAMDSSWNVIAYRAAVWARENTRDSDVFAMSDNGHFGFFSRRNAVNLDGVVNNFEYLSAVKNKTVSRYFKEKHVDYLAEHVWTEDNVIEGNYEAFSVFRIMYGEDYPAAGDELIVRKSNEVYRSHTYSEGANKSVLIIWKLVEFSKSPEGNRGE